MKVVALLPFKNEEWILPAYLSSVGPVVDEIVGVDDGSTDSSRRLVEEAGGHVVSAPVGGDWETHWGAIREELLRVGRARGGSHFVCLDADEALTTPAQEHLRPALEGLEPGQKIVLQWLALWKSSFQYRNDESVWSNNLKDFAFADAGGYAFVGQWPHRIGRTPGPNQESLWRHLPREHGAVLHFQFVPWTRFQVKQAWYRCAELIRAPGTAVDINRTYAHGLDDPRARTRRVPDEWVRGLEIPQHLEALAPTWHWDEMLAWFDEYGIEFFEPLQIWHITPLRERFVAQVGREPRPAVRLSPARRVLRAIGSRVAVAKTGRG